MPLQRMVVSSSDRTTWMGSTTMGSTTIFVTVLELVAHVFAASCLVDDERRGWIGPTMSSFGIGAMPLMLLMDVEMWRCGDVEM